jgi:hypothetical protein
MGRILSSEREREKENGRSRENTVSLRLLL